MKKMNFNKLFISAVNMLNYYTPSFHAAGGDCDRRLSSLQSRNTISGSPGKVDPTSLKISRLKDLVGLFKSMTSDDVTQSIAPMHSMPGANYTRKLAAIHEAGHVVMAILKGIPLSHAIVLFDEGCTDITQTNVIRKSPDVYKRGSLLWNIQWERNISMIFGGAAAELLEFGYFNLGGSQCDINQAKELFEMTDLIFDNDMIDSWVQRVAEELSDETVWATLLEISYVLLERKILDTDYLRRIANLPLAQVRQS